jgi:hypothetical protein
MLLMVSGAILVVAVALAALYDNVARRRGVNVGISASGPFLARATISRALAQDGSGRRRLIGDEARRVPADGDA